jgi:hypothetical protein
MEFYWLILGILAVWRVTHLLQAEDGPWNLVVRLRRAAGNGFLGQLLDCFQCLSLWVAAPAAGLIGNGWQQRIFLWLALSGGAILIETMSRRESPPGRAVYHEDEDLDNVMLREAEKPDSVGPTHPGAL